MQSESDIMDSPPMESEMILVNLKVPDEIVGKARARAKKIFSVIGSAWMLFGRKPSAKNMEEARKIVRHRVLEIEPKRVVFRFHGRRIEARRDLIGRVRVADIGAHTTGCRCSTKFDMGVSE